MQNEEIQYSIVLGVCNDGIIDLFYSLWHLVSKSRTEKEICFDFRLKLSVNELENVFYFFLFAIWKKIQGSGLVIL